MNLDKIKALCELESRIANEAALFEGTGLYPTYRTHLATILAAIAELKPLVEGATADVFAERKRQQQGEGWTVEHDDSHTDCSLAKAAAIYAWPVKGELTVAEQNSTGVRLKDPWPWWIEPNWELRGVDWKKSWYKPKDRRSDLVRAAALIIAEIERLDRLAARPK
ncbi:MAG: hypothetical protein ACRCUC_02255 [Aestuariivirga sp.]